VSDPKAFLTDLIAAFGGRPQTKHALVAVLSRKYAIDTRTVNQWLYRNEGRLFSKDRDPAHGLPTWTVIGRIAAPETPLKEACPLHIRPSRWNRLHDWQKEAIVAWIDNGEMGIVEAVTGAGKTDVGIALVEHALNRGERILVLVPMNTLKDQWVERLRADVCDHLGVEVDAVSKTPSWAWRRGRVLVAHPTTVVRAIETERLDPSTIGLVIADEAHHYGARRWQHALDEEFESRLALSATIGPGTGGFGDVLEPYFGGVVYSLDFEKAYGFELLAPFRLALVGCRFSEEEQAAYDEARGRYKRAYKSLRKAAPWIENLSGSEFFAEVQRLAERADTRDIGIAAKTLFSAITEQRDLQASCSGKLRALPEILQVAAHRQRGIVFTGTKQAAREAEQACAFAGVVGQSITADTPQEQRTEILASFRAGETRVLIGPKVLDEGLDIPEADFGVVISASRSRRQMVQRFGRLLRKKPDDGDAAIVVTYVIGTNEDPTHANRDGFMSDLEDLADVDVERFEADAEMGRLLGYLLP
jgi:RNA polymerase primary sigma factor